LFDIKQNIVLVLLLLLRVRTSETKSYNGIINKLGFPIAEINAQWSAVHYLSGLSKPPGRQLVGLFPYTSLLKGIVNSSDFYLS